MLTTNRPGKKESGFGESSAPRSASTVSLLNPEEEALLLERCLANDKGAWDTLLRVYEKSVYRFAYMLCRNRDDAADIAGHVFVRVYQNLHTFRHDACFSSWLFRIVRNTYLDLCVRPAYRNNVSLDADSNSDTGLSRTQIREIADPCPSPETACIKKEIAKLLNAAVSHLPRYQREVVQMYHSDGKSYEQIAEATGLSIGTVKSRLSRARAMLRERLTPYMDTLTCS
jgi:RNA polymerase sigma-70 factor (ECF subfamily)